MWGCFVRRDARVACRRLWHAGVCFAYPVRGSETPSRTCGTSGAAACPTSRTLVTLVTLVTLARDADVRIPGLFGLPAFAPASADGTARSDGGDAAEVTDKPREHARPLSACDATSVTTVTTQVTK